ncbi:MAG: flavin reductase family protein [candidate division WOR-3 bacterium]
MKKSILVMLVVVVVCFNLVVSGKSVEEEVIHMEKVEARHYDPPLPVSLIGTKSGEQINFMTCAWFTRLEIDPYLFGISIQRQHFTHKAIMENRCFSINIPGIDLIKKVDAVGLVSGKEYDKSKVFDVFYGDNEKSPMVNGSIVSFECEVVDTLNLVKADEEHPRAHTLFIGKVKNVWVNKNALKNGALDYETLNPIIWTMSPNSYWTIGENKGQAFNQDNIKLVPKKE